MSRELSISQEFWDEHHSKEFAQARYEVAKGINEFERKQRSRMVVLKELEGKFVDISNSVFKVLNMGAWDLSRMSNVDLIKKEHELKRGQKGLEGLYCLNADYLTILHGPEGLNKAYDDAMSDPNFFHPNYEQAAVIIDSALIKIEDEMELRQRKR